MVLEGPLHLLGFRKTQVSSLWCPRRSPRARVRSAHERRTGREWTRPSSLKGRCQGRSRGTESSFALRTWHRALNRDCDREVQRCLLWLAEQSEETFCASV